MFYAILGFMGTQLMSGESSLSQVFMETFMETQEEENVCINNW